MKRMLLFAATALLFSNAASSQTVDLKDGANNFIATYNSIGAAYAAIPATLTQGYIIELKSAYVSTTETFPILMTAKSGASASNTITVRPAAGVTAALISGSTGSNSALIRLDDADYINIDGRPGGVGNTIGLTISQLGNITTSYSIWLINGATHNNFRYCNIVGTGSGSGGNKSIYVNTSASNTSGNSDNNFEFLHFTGARTSINSSGTDANNNNNLRIYGCEFENIKFAGFWAQGGNGLTTIDSNYFYSNAAAGTSGTGTFAILVDFLGDSLYISRNRITTMDNSANTTNVYGIVIRSLDPFPSYTRIANNFIALTAPNTAANVVYGIEYGSNSWNNPHTADVHFNTIRIAGTSTGGTAGNVGSAGLSIDASNLNSTVNMTNNIIVNERTGGNEQHLGIAQITSNGTMNRSNNTYSVASGNIARVGTTLYTAMPAYQAAITAGETNSNTSAVVFTGINDLHLSGTSVGDPTLAGAASALVPLDIDGDARVTPYRGADEAGPIVQCSGTPAAGVATGPSAIPCPGASYTLTSTGQSSGPGIYYQWQVREAGSTNAWTAIPGGSSATVSYSSQLNQEFRFMDSCGASGLKAFSNVVVVNNASLPVVASIGETHSQLQYSFSATGVQNATGYSWDFGDNTALSTLVAPAHTYAQPGTYSVRLIVSNACSTDTAWLSITATGCSSMPLSTGLFVSDTAVCLSDSLSMNAVLLHVIWATNDTAAAPYLDVQWQQSPDGLVWNDIPGATNDTLSAYPNTTRYYRYRVSCGSSSLTSISVIRTVTVLPPASFASVSVIQNGLQADFTIQNPQNILTYRWNFGDNSAPVTGGPVQTHIYPSAGSYVVMVSGYGTCDTVTVAQQVTVAVGVKEAAQAAGVSWFPNPVQKVLQVRSGGAKLQVMTVINSYGAVVLQQDSQSESAAELVLEKLAAGSYYLRLQTADGLLHLPFQKL